MYQYTEFDRQFVKARAAQYRDQLERNLAGTLGDEEFKPLRLQNGWYIQRYAPMLRVAVPYGELSSTQLRVLATIARDYDQPAQPCSTKHRPPRTNWARFPCRAACLRSPNSPRATGTSPPVPTCSSTGFRWSKART